MYLSRTSGKMSHDACWLCGEEPRAPSKCSFALPYSAETVPIFVKKIGVKCPRDDNEGDVVCEFCLSLLKRIDQLSFEMDICIVDLRRRCEKGETSFMTCLLLFINKI
jgi:hypothetical protein